MSTKRTYDMIPLLKKFVVNTSKDKRRMPSGQKMTKGTKQNYQLLLERFLEFKELTQFDLKVYSLTSSNKRAYNQARLYHQNIVLPKNRTFQMINKFELLNEQKEKKIQFRV